MSRSKQDRRRALRERDRAVARNRRHATELVEGVLDDAPPVEVARFDDDGRLRALTASAPVPEPSDDQVEAYDDGRAAYGAGNPSTTCPHDPHSDLGTLWLRGYVLARRDDQYGPVR